MNFCSVFKHTHAHTEILHENERIIFSKLKVTQHKLKFLNKHINLSFLKGTKISKVKQTCAY